MEGDTFFHVPFVRWVRPSRLLELENGPFPCCWLRVETKWKQDGWGAEVTMECVRLHFSLSDVELCPGWIRRCRGGLRCGQ
jgi:hypothetical protein